MNTGNRQTPRCAHRTIAFIVALALHCAVPAVLHAQSAAARELTRIDALVASSRFSSAAASLDAWSQQYGSSADADARSAAALLRARITTDADSARTLYLALALGYPSSAEAPVAFLRLAQIAFAQNDRLRARDYLQRVVSDYPRSPAHDDAVAWLRRISDVPATTKRTDADDGAYALQIAAFRERSTALTVAAKLKSRGFDARVVYVPGSSLARVRVGRFATADAADATIRKLRSAGYEAVVVDDARSETPPQK
jgi:hypothetical protein